MNDDRPTLSNRFLVKDLFLVCSLCDRVVSCPVETPCHHFFCVGCIVSFFVSAKNACPTCLTSIHYTQVTPVPDYVHSLLSDLHAICLRCNIKINHTGIRNHICQDTLKADHSYCKKQSPSYPIRKGTYRHPSIDDQNVTICRWQDSRIQNI